MSKIFSGNYMSKILFIINKFIYNYLKNYILEENNVD